MKKILTILTAICALSCCLAEAQGKKSVVSRTVLFTINLSASNDDFSYKGTSSLTYQGYKTNDVQTSGNFFRWMTALRVGMRF
jgi:hypothetical protein